MSCAPSLLRSRRVGVPNGMPWLEGFNNGWPLTNGQECPVVSLEGFSVGCSIFFNPGSQSLTGGTFKINAYARVRNQRALVGSFTCTSGPTQLFSVLQACMGWDITFLFQVITHLPSYTGILPSVAVIAHGREY